MPSSRNQVFINVPFDRAYRKLFEALVFAVIDCGFAARCALEADDGSEIRLQKLYDIIRACRYGIHDLSRVTLDGANRLPRFNMPLELGIFLGAKEFGQGAQGEKTCLILEREPFRYQKYCSDIAGQDVRPHANDTAQAIAAVRDWLRTANRGVVNLPSARRLQQRYVSFRGNLPDACRAMDLDLRNLSFIDYCTLVDGWRAEDE